MDIFTLIYPFSSLSPSLWETARYRLKYELSQRAVKPKTTNQPTFFPLWETVRCRLKYCLKGPLNPKPSINLWESARYSWLVGCFGFNIPLRQYFSLYRAVSQREGERRERIDESKNVQTTPIRTYCKRNGPLPYCYQICRTPPALEGYPAPSHHPTTPARYRLKYSLKGPLSPKRPTYIIFKVFTMYGHGGHVGPVTQTI